MYNLVITSPELHGLTTALKDGASFVTRPVALNYIRDGQELLVHGGDARPHEGRLVTWAVTPDSPNLPRDTAVLMSSDALSIIAGLGIGTGPRAGQMTGWVRLSGTAEPVPLKTLRIIGPRMPLLDLGKSGRALELPILGPENGLYSRMVGVVGEAAVARLQKARIAVIGAGENGSLFASQLARLMGRRGQLILVDADNLAAHNLPVWAATGTIPPSRLIGRNKAEALAECLRHLPDPPEICAIPAPLLDWTAYGALKRCEILVSCVDNIAARFVASFLATLYLKPLLDVSTAVFFGKGENEHRHFLQQNIWEQQKSFTTIRAQPPLLPGLLRSAGPRTMRADVRFTLPGDAPNGGCLLCRGALGRVEEIKQALTTVPISTPFWYDRAGSLFELNSDAVNQGVRSLLSFLGGQKIDYTHLQMDATLSLPPQWRQVTVTRQPCQLCAMSGFGDGACNRMEDILNNAQATPQ